VTELEMFYASAKRNQVRTLFAWLKFTKYSIYLNHFSKHINQLHSRLYMQPETAISTSIDSRV